VRRDAFALNIQTEYVTWNALENFRETDIWKSNKLEPLGGKRILATPVCLMYNILKHSAKETHQANINYDCYGKNKQRNKLVISLPMFHSNACVPWIPWNYIIALEFRMNLLLLALKFFVNGFLSKSVRITVLVRRVEDQILNNYIHTWMNECK